jgi:hypothetical protein
LADESSRFHSERFLPLVESTITRYELTTANWAFLNVTTGNMELALQNSAVMARNAVSVPVILLASVWSASDGFPV